MPWRREAFRRIGCAGQVRPKINFENVENFHRPVCVHFSPRFHHDFARIYHAKYHHLRTRFPRNPLKNEEIPMQKNLCFHEKLKSANKQFPLVDHLGRQMVVEQDEQLFMAHDLPLPLRAVDSLQLIKGGA